MLYITSALDLSSTWKTRTAKCAEFGQLQLQTYYVMILQTVVKLPQNDNVLCSTFSENFILYNEASNKHKPNDNIRAERRRHARLVMF